MEMFDLLLAALLIGGLIGLLIGAAIGSCAARPAELSDHVVSAMREVAEWEQPRLTEWTPEVTARWRAQQAARRIG